MAIGDDLSARLRAIPAPIQGALIMTAAAFCFSVMNVFVRLATEQMAALEVAFFRNFFALAFMLPWLARTGLGSLRTERIKLHLLRAFFALATMITWFSALAILPLGDAVALNFTVPLFATAGAALVLGEVVRARRWTATVVGFLGTLIILRPGFAEVTPAMALPILAAVSMACASLTVKSLSRSESAATIVIYMTLILTPLSLIPALFVWQWPDLETLGYLIGLGGSGALAHLLLTISFAKADASAVIPFDYARLPFVAVIAFFLFGEVPDFWTWLGAAVIAASAIYIAHREARVARQGAASESPRARP
ncbi:MAG: DMT family transporter [Alphaproteobacteria bacterium]